jgi:hypothetical protein
VRFRSVGISNRIGMLGFIARRRKRKAAALAAA